MPMHTRFTKQFSNLEAVDGRKEGLAAASAFLGGQVSPPLLLFYGPPGRSKTHLALAIAWVFLARGEDVAFYHVGDLLDQLYAGMNVPAAGHQRRYSLEYILNYVKNSSLLVLDDMGVEHDSGFGRAKLDTIVNYRYEGELPTVITANSLDLPDRILDRCKEGRTAMLGGESYRDIIQRRKLGDIS